MLAGADDFWTDEEHAPEPASRLSRLAWGTVFVLAAVLVLAAITLASTALLSPDAWTGACKRTQLVRPEGCSVSDVDG